MYHALEIHEIFCNILFYCHQPHPNARGCKHAAPTLPALARTCRTFKEPTLDLLWRDLNDSSPLVRCLPEACYRVRTKNAYSFNRKLTQTDWDVLQSYARRIHAIRNFKSGVDWESAMTFLNPPAGTGSLFPNLRSMMHCEYTKHTMPLLRLPLPSLVSLSVKFENLYLLESFPNFSPNIRLLHMRVDQENDEFIKIEPSYVTRWRNLHLVSCSQVAWDWDALIDLSRLPALTRLDFALSAVPPPSDILILFSNMRRMKLYSCSLESISCWFSRSRLPAIIGLSASVDSCSSTQALTSFFAGVPTCNTGRTVETLSLCQRSLLPDGVHILEGLLLCFEDLRPWMEFTNLRRIDINIYSNVDLKDSEILTLASAWPKLTHLNINADTGWKLRGGATPGALVQLLRTCPSLEQVSLAIDTRGYTRVPPGQMREHLGLTLPSGFSINVVDSVIDAECVPAIATFFCGLGACCGADFSFIAWEGAWMRWFPTFKEHEPRWRVVGCHVNNALMQAWYLNRIVRPYHR